MANAIITVPFHGQKLFLVEHNGEPYTPMKPIVEGMGLAWQTQLRKLAANTARWGITKMVIPSIDKNNELTCLPLRKLFGWLSTISPNKVKPELKQRVEWYQNECDDVLYQHWTTKTQTKQIETLTPAMQRHIQKRVTEMTLTGSGLSYPQVYRRIKDNFHVGTYKDVPAKKYPELCRFLNCQPEPAALQGELLERETLPASTGNVTIPGNGRWLVVMENNNATVVSNIDNKSVIDFQLHRKLQHDAMYASAVLADLSKRLRITSGECSASEFNVSLEDKFNA